MGQLRNIMSQQFLSADLFTWSAGTEPDTHIKTPTTPFTNPTPTTLSGLLNLQTLVVVMGFLLSHLAVLTSFRDTDAGIQLSTVQVTG